MVTTDTKDMNRKQLVSGLRSLHEDDEISNIRLIKRSQAIVVDYTADQFTSNPRSGQLIIAEPNPQPKTKKPKS